MRYRGVALAAAPALLLVLSFPSSVICRPALAQDTVNIQPMTRAAITSIQGDEATISAGANVGLTVGMDLPVLQDGREAGRIVLTRVGTDSSVGRLTSAEGFTVKVLDLVQLPSTGVPSATVPAPTPVPVLEQPTTTTAIGTTASPAPAPVINERDEKPSYNEHEMDIIPWERWEYMALSSLAADGLLHGYASRDFQGTRQFTRGQLAEITALGLTAVASGAGHDRDRMLLFRLAEEFKFQPAVRDAQAAIAEIEASGPKGLAAPGSSDSALSAYGGPRIWSFRNESHANLTGRVGGLYDLTGNAFLALSINNLHRLTSALPKAFPGVDVATVNFRALGTDFEVGKTYWFSGPVYSGDGLLSDNAPGLYMAKGRKTFSWGKIGKFTMTQIYGGFHQFDGTKYYGLRRVETAIGRKLEFGLSESYIATKAPNPLIFVLPFYAYQRTQVFHQSVGGHAGGSNENSEFNYMAQLDASYHLNRHVTPYAEFVIDDITAPFGLGQGHVPRKTAFVLGAHFPTLFGGRGEGRFEIYNADRDTYLGIAPQVSYTEKDLLLGSPFGSNTQAFFGRLDYRFTDKLKGILQLRDAVQFHNGQPDMGDRYELSITGAYDMKPNQSVSLRVVPQRFRGQGYVIRSTGAELMATYAY